MSVYFYEPLYDLERFIDILVSPSGSQKQQPQCARGCEGTANVYKPRLDLHEDVEKNLVTVTFEFPGISKEDIRIDHQNGKLTVSAETKREHDKTGYTIRERNFGKYSRTLQLPQGVKDEDIKASVENGVLTVTFPKSTPEVAPKRVSIA